MISCSFVSKLEIKALTSISDDEDLEPPEARPLETTSPSRVTTITSGWLRRIASAALASSATTIPDNNVDSSSPIEFERT